jgi:RNase H-fold protein (predicted Holliday junction resolvase)
MEPIVEKKVIIGIDFGTAGIGFAYGFLNDP